MLPRAVRPDEHPAVVGETIYRVELHVGRPTWSGSTRKVTCQPLAWSTTVRRAPMLTSSGTILTPKFPKYELNDEVTRSAGGGIVSRVVLRGSAAMPLTTS